MGNCDASVRLLARAADGALGAVEFDRLREHLWQCAACRAELDRQIEVRAALAARGETPLPAGFGPRLAARLEAEAPWAPAARVGRLPPPGGWVDLVDWRKWSLRLFPVAAALGLVAIADGPYARQPLPIDLATAVEGWSLPEESMPRTVMHPETSEESALLALLIRASRQAPAEDP